jgi:hypothetical protein
MTRAEHRRPTVLALIAKWTLRFLILIVILAFTGATFLFNPFVPRGASSVAAERKALGAHAVLIQTASPGLDGFQVALYIRLPGEGRWRRYFIDHDSHYLFAARLEPGEVVGDVRVSDYGRHLATLRLGRDEIYLTRGEQTIKGHVDVRAPPGFESTE